MSQEQNKPIPFDTYLTDEEDEDVCCVGCGERVCGFHEDPPYKNLRDEAVCDDCVKCLSRHEFTSATDDEDDGEYPADHESWTGKWCDGCKSYMIKGRWVGCEDCDK